MPSKVHATIFSKSRLHLRHWWRYKEFVKCLGRSNFSGWLHPPSASAANRHALPTDGLSFLVVFSEVTVPSRVLAFPVHLTIFKTHRKVCQSKLRITDQTAQRWHDLCRPSPMFYWSLEKR